MSPERLIMNESMFLKESLPPPHKKKTHNAKKREKKNSLVTTYVINNVAYRNILIWTNQFSGFQKTTTKKYNLLNEWYNDSIFRKRIHWMPSSGVKMYTLLNGFWMNQRMNFSFSKYLTNHWDESKSPLQVSVKCVRIWMWMNLKRIKSWTPLFLNESPEWMKLLKLLKKIKYNITSRNSYRTNQWTNLDLFLGVRKIQWITDMNHNPQYKCYVCNSK